MKKLVLTLFLSIFIQYSLFSQSPAPSGLLCELLSHPELSVITNPAPSLAWIVNSGKQGDSQLAYRIILASSEGLLSQENGDMWNSGKVNSNQSINIRYAGKSLKPNESYWWKVKTYNKLSGESAWSKVQRFNTAEFNSPKTWPDESKWVKIRNSEGKSTLALENRHPVIYHPVVPVKKTIRKNGVQFFDFGRAAFAALDLNLTWTPKDPTAKQLALKINIGEKSAGDSIDQKPGGGVIFRTYTIQVKPGTGNYSLPIPRFVPKYPHSQAMPPEMPEVVPFRFFEIRSLDERVKVNDITQKALYYLYDENAANFSSSNPSLDAVYDLSKYSTIANTFNGDYANSERERMMYEADCYIQQMSHYAIDREFAIARYSLQNLVYHATWPTEWISQSIFMAWADYLHTGNTDVISRYYNELKPKTLTALETDNGLISTRTGLQTQEFLNSIHFNGKKLSDIVDWPNTTKTKGWEKGETDNYDFTDYNTVVNAFYYQALRYMANMGEAIGKKDDALFYRQKSESVKAAFNKYFFDSDRGVYVDGIGSKHSSLHANMYALCFDLVPEKNRASVIDYIKSKRMACGVYGANYLLEALFNNGEADYALSLLTDTTDRSWLNMIRVGSTITTEAWDNKYKGNNGWTHAWSASPAHILPRKIMGVEPLDPGFGKIAIKPQPGSLPHAQARVPTIRGAVDVNFTQQPGKSFDLAITIPANTTADVYIPKKGGSYKLIVDGKASKGEDKTDFVLVKDVKSGSHVYKILYN